MTSTSELPSTMSRMSDFSYQSCSKPGGEKDTAGKSPLQWYSLFSDNVTYITFIFTCLILQLHEAFTCLNTEFTCLRQALVLMNQKGETEECSCTSKITMSYCGGFYYNPTMVSRHFYRDITIYWISWYHNIFLVISWNSIYRYIPTNNTWLISC